MEYVVHHNPDCGTSRNVVSVIEAAGYQPVVIEYLNTGWTRPQLQALFAAAALTPRQALRESHDLATELGLLDAQISDETLLDMMIEYPILVNRPIVSCPKGVALCRPAEKILSLLATPLTQKYHIEKGKIIFDD